MPLRGMGYSVAGLGKVAKRLFDLRIIGATGGETGATGGETGATGGETGAAFAARDVLVTGYQRGKGNWGLGRWGSGALLYYSYPVLMNTDIVLEDYDLAVSFGLGLSGSDLYGWGSNEYLPGNDNVSNIRRNIIRLADVDTANSAPLTSVASYAAFSTGGLIVTTDGKLYSFGTSSNGELGLGATTTATTVTRIGTDADWAKVFSFSNNNFAIKTNGTLWAWGSGGSYQLGLGDTTNRTTPTQVGSDSDWDEVFPLFRNVFARKTNGTIWAWGQDFTSGATVYGLLGLSGGAASSVSTPSQITATGATGFTRIQQLGSSSMMALKADGTLYYWGTEASSQEPIPHATHTGPYKDICGVYGSNTNTKILIKTDGTMYSVGYGSNGYLGRTGSTSLEQIGSSSNWEMVRAVDTTTYHGFLAKNAGELYWWAYQSFSMPVSFIIQNDYIELPIGSWSDLWQTQTTVLGLKPDGTLWMWGGCSITGITQFDQGNPIQIESDSDWVKGGIYDYTGLGNGPDSTYRFYPTVAALKSNGTLWTLGIAGGTTQTTFTQVGSDTDWNDIAVGDYIILTKDDGSLWQMPYSGTGPTQLGGATGWRSIYAAQKRFGAIDQTGRLYTWGLETTIDYTPYAFGYSVATPMSLYSSPQAVTAADGFTGPWKSLHLSHKGPPSAYAIAENGNLYHWGLGTDGPPSYNTPTKVFSGTTGWIDIGSKVDVSVGAKGSTYYKSSYGIRSTSGSTASGDLYVWGYNGNGVLGIGMSIAGAFTSPTTPTLAKTGNFVKIVTDVQYTTGSNTLEPSATFVLREQQ